MQASEGEPRSRRLSVSQRLQALRRRCGMTQQEVADVLGVSLTAYAVYEAGGAPPPPDLLQRFCDRLGFSPNVWEDCAPGALAEPKASPPQPLACALSPGIAWEPAQLDRLFAAVFPPNDVSS